MKTNHEDAKTQDNNRNPLVPLCLSGEFLEFLRRVRSYVNEMHLREELDGWIERIRAARASKRCRRDAKEPPLPGGRGPERGRGPESAH